MPQPIVPIHKQESMPITFGESMQPEFQFSTIQSILLQTTAASKPNVKYSMNTIAALQNIDKNTDFKNALSEIGVYIHTHDHKHEH